MFDNPILKKMMDRYGHIDDLDQLQSAMSEDGFGEFVDLLNNNPELFNSFIDEHREDIEQSIRNYTGSGTMPIQEPIKGQPLSNDDTFRFDPQLCLTDCNGKCCKGRNYLMILYPDIFKILTSTAARHLKIHSTQDLIERKPPIIDLFLNEKYDLYLPYLRFLPIGADPNTPPEEAEDSICPFLYPISDVFSFHKLQLPQNVHKDAMGCMLMDCKPSICRLSPVGQARGMVTGRLSYEYIEPAKNCPGCAADVEIPLPQYVNALLSSSDEEERALFHKMLMAHHTRRQEGYDQKKFESVLVEFYNIDRLLAENEFAPQRRPSCGQLLKILIAAAQGDVSLYDKFIQSMNKSNHATMKISRNDREYTYNLKMERYLFEKIRETISKFCYSAGPFLEASKKINVYENLYELENFYYHAWQKQELDGARGLCQHLSSLTHKYLADLAMGHKKFSDYYDIYYASGVYESKFFSWPYGNHICLIIFKKGETEDGWIIDPSLKKFGKCFKTLNSHRDIIDYKEVFTTDSDHKYLISAKVGSAIRKHLEIKENAFTDYSSSFDTYLPLFIYKDDSLILAKFRREINSVFVEYYDHKENCKFSQKKLINHHTTKYKELYNYSNVFSIIDSLLTKVSIIDSSEVDQHQRLVSTELEEDYPMILYYIEQTIVLAYQKISDLTDRIVANALKELISQKEDRIYRVDYFVAKEEMMHRELLVQIKSVGLESKCPKRILVNAFKQVLGSVTGFIKQGTADDAYLKFILGYFE